ncbi:LacI family DNA-binding transcriptional regulator [Photobacterium sp. DNB23_23_1]
MQTNSHKKPTLEHIATIAGVSKATVSRVLNGSPKVKEDVVKRVEAIIEETGYVKKRSALEIPLTLDTLTVFCDDSAFAPHTFYGTLLNELKIEASKLNIKLEMSMFNQLTSDEQLSSRLDQAQALLILGTPNQDVIRQGQKTKLPIVIINGVDPYMQYQSISPDYEFGGFLATDHLIRHGHSKIKILTANDRHSTYQRTDGFLRAMNMAGIEFDRDDVVVDFVKYADKVESARGLSGNELITNPSGDFGAREILPLLIDEGVFNDCTAVFCICDMMALSLIEALSSLGVRVPEDISVIGFDNLGVGAISTPPLTTISADYNKIAQTAVHKLITIMSTPAKVATRSSMAVELIQRGSVAAPQ